MKKPLLMIILSLLFSIPLREVIFNSNPLDNPLIRQVLRNKPNINTNFAMKLVQATEKQAKKHKIPPELMLAVCMQESGYNIKATSSTQDYGICQINIKNIKHFKMDKKRLVTDLDYSLDMAFMIMAQFKRKKTPNWYAFYNSSNKTAQKKYIKLVGRWF